MRSKLILSLMLLFVIIPITTANTCLKAEKHICSNLDFKDYLLSNYTPADYGLKNSDLVCPPPLHCYEKVFKVYQGNGNYSLSPGDEVHFEKGYIIKYTTFHRQTSWASSKGTVTGNSATVDIYKGEVNYEKILVDNYVASLATIDDIHKEETKTFSNGFYFYAQPLKENSNTLSAEIFMGSISTCSDTDSYSLGKTLLEGLETPGRYGINYYKKGTATEQRDDINGRKETSKEDTCIENRLIEYYCDGGELESEEKKCACLDESTCKKGFFDSIREWIGKNFGNLS